MRKKNDSFWSGADFIRKAVALSTVLFLIGTLLVMVPEEALAETRPGGTLENDTPARVYTTGWWWSTIPDELSFKVPSKTNHYTAVAIVNQQSGEDFDLFAYNDYGMSQGIASSTQGSNAIDFVVIDGHTYTGNYKYAKVIKFTGQDWTSGIRIESDYHTVAADLFGSDPDADGYLEIGERRYSMFEYHGSSTYDGTLRGDYPLVNMYDVYLDAGGIYDFDIYNVPTGQALSMYLFKGSGNSDDALLTDSATAAGPLSFTYQPEASGYYGLCVIDDNPTTGYSSISNYTVLITSDFEMNADPTSRLIAPGMNTSFAIDVESLGITKDFDLHYRWQNSGGANVSTPAGAVASLSNTTANTGGVGTKRVYLNVSTTTSMTAGTYYLAVYGNDTGYNGGSKKVSVLLKVSTNPDFFLKAEPANKVVSPGTAALYTIGMDTINNFGNNVSLSASVDRNPTSFNFSFSPASINKSSSNSTATVNTLSSTPVGNYNITIRGYDGSLTRYANVTIRVKEPISIDIISPSLDEIVSGVYNFRVKAGTPAEVKSVKITYGGKMRAAGTLNTYYSSSSQTWERTVNTYTYADGLCWLNITAEDYGGGVTTFGPRNFTLSNSAPNPIINTPKDRSYVTGSSMPISVNTTSYVISCRFRVDQNAWTPLIRSGNTWTGTYDTTLITDGSHSLTIEAKDSAGLTGETTVTIFVDNNNPTCNMNSPISGQYIEGTYTFRVVATDTVGVKNVDINIFGENVTLPYNPVTSSYEYTLTTTTKTDGIYQVSATAYDYVGHSKTSPVVTFNIDNNDPSLEIKKPIDDEIIGGQYNVQVTSSDTFMSKVEYMIDSAGWQAMNGIQPNYYVLLNTTALTDGAHKLTVRALDNLSHKTEQAIDFTVDNHAPTCNVVSPFQGAFISGVHTFKVSSSDTVGIDTVILSVFDEEYDTSYNRQTGYYEYQINTLILTDGTYSVHAMSTDLSGKTKNSTQISFKVDNEAPLMTVNGLQTNDYISGDILLNVTVSDAFLRDVRYSIDGGDWRMINSTWRTTQIQDGKHTLRIQARDLAGHSTTQSLDLIVDNHLPVCAVNAPVANEFIDGAYTFKISASDSVGIERVEIQVFSNNFSTTYSSASGYYEFTTDTSIRQDRNYSCYAIVYDKSGKRNTSVSVSFQIDNNAPVLRVYYPMEGGYLEGNVTMNVSATDVFLDKVEYRVDGSGWVPVSTVLDTRTFGDGSHTISFRALDLSGRISTTNVGVKFDNNVPTGSITTPAQGQYVEGVGGFTALASDNVGIRKVQIEIFGSTLDMSYNSNTGNYEYKTDTRLIADGTYTMYVSIEDLSGKKLRLGPRQFHIDNNAPVLRVISPLSGDYLEDEVDLRVNATDVFLDKVEYDVDGTGWTSISTPLNTTLFGDGDHRINIRAVDKAGHVTSSFVDIIIDNTLPTGNIGSPATNQYIEGTYIFTALASDIVGIDKVQITVFNFTFDMNYNSGTGSYEYRTDTRLMKDGTYLLYIDIFDLSGKTIKLGPRFFYIDNNAPVMTIIYPSAGEYLEGEERILANVTDAFLDKVEYNIDETGWVPINTTLNTTLFSDGKHRIVIRSLDKAGHSITASLEVIIDNTHPYGAINSPANSQFIGGIYVFQAVASDIVGVKDVVIEVFNSTLDMNYNSGSGYYEFSTDTSLRPDGNYTVFVHVTDLSGKITMVGPRYFQIDNNYPDLEVYQLNDDDILSGVLVFNYSAADEFLKSVEYQIDNTGWQGIDTPFDTAKVSDGAHNIRIRAVDWSGKVSNVNFEVRVDNLKPTCTINSPVEGEFVEGIVTIRVSAFDVVGIDYVLIRVYTLEARVPYNTQTGYYEYTSNTITWGSGEDGVRNVTATAYDLTGKSYSYGPVNFNVDNRPPTINIKSPKEGEIVSGLFFFDVVNGDVFKKGTEYNIDGSSWLPVSIGWNTNLVQDGLHEITIKATDQAGHVTLETIYVYVDNHAPVVSLASPVDNEFVEGAYIFKVSASDEVGIHSVIMKVAGQTRPLSFNMQSGYYEYLLDTRTLADGNYEINATATDLFGRKVTTPTLGFRVDNEDPELIVESPIKGQLISGVFVIRARGMDEFPGVVRYAVDGTTWFDVNTPWNTTKIGDGPHIITVMTQDQAGHRTEFKVDVLVDNTAPTVSQASITPGESVNGIKLLRFYVVDSIGIEHVMIILNEGTDHESSEFEIFRGEGGLYYEHLLDTVILGDGDHTISVTALDRADNSEKAIYGIRVDNTGPRISLDYYWIEGDNEVRIGDVKEGTSVVFEATVTDPSGVGVVLINIDSSGWREMAPDSNTSNPNKFVLFWPTSGTQGGSHIFQIRTADKLGNEATTSGLINIREKEKKTSFVDSFTGVLPILWFFLFIIILIAIVVLAYFGILVRLARGDLWKKKEEQPAQEELPERKGREPPANREPPVKKERAKPSNPFKRTPKTDEKVENWDDKVVNE
ncbi:MAG: Ig-like domain-containing protein [Thermoplasmatota archaeon]